MSVTQKERDLAKKEFENLFEAIYSDSIRVTLWDSMVRNGNREYARIQSRGATSVKLGINWDKWQSSSPEKQLQILLHEISHIDHGNHKIEFWKTYARNFLDARDQRHLFKRGYDWNEVGRQIIFDAHDNNVDRRQISIGEMRAKLENIIGITVNDSYSRGKYEAKFDDVHNISSSINAGPVIVVSDIFDDVPDNLEFTKEFSTKELWKKFNEVRRKDTITSGNKSWIVPPPEVKNRKPESHDAARNSSRNIVFCSEEDEKLAQLWVRNDYSTFRPRWDSC